MRLENDGASVSENEVKGISENLKFYCEYLRTKNVSPQVKRRMQSTRTGEVVIPSSCSVD